MVEYKLSDDTWDFREIEAIKRVIKSKQFTMGEEVREYESEFAKKMNSKYAVMSNSGSSANLLAVASLLYSGKISKGDEVIVPAVSWSTTYFPFYQYGLKLRFVDIDRGTLNIDVGKIEEAITEKTKAIMIVNLLGNPNDFAKIEEICERFNLILIEDNCEALGGKYEDKYLGTFGLLGTFSTFYSHHLCTMEGGITVTNNEILYYYMLSLRAHGWTRNLPSKNTIYNKKREEFYESYNFILPGYNLRPLEIEAAIGREQLLKMDLIINQRKRNAAYFKENVSTIDGIMIQKEIGISSWFGFSILLTEENTGRRNEVVKALKKSNIEVRPIVAGNFTRNEAINYIDYSISGELVNADFIHDNGFFIGNHSRDNGKEIDHFVNVLRGVLK